MARLLVLASVVTGMYFGGAALIGQELHAATDATQMVKLQIDSVTTSVSHGVSALENAQTPLSHSSGGG